MEYNGLLASADYYIDLINSSKAYQMTAQYHYSGVGFKKAILNQGIYRKSDDVLVGVLQWGCSFQEGIRLDRYVKEPINKDEYLELNRFSMADCEGKNAESQAIGLGIKWIKKYRPNIRLLVSYAGRKEGNYGYIYQATNWEYLGYFISDGFWFLDGEERHKITIWNRYMAHNEKNLSLEGWLKDTYHDVRYTWTKQFIYIQRLDKKLTCASPVLPYPKPANEYPICTKVQILKQDDEWFNQDHSNQKEKIWFTYEKEELLFSKSALRRRGEMPLYATTWAIYSKNGELEFVAHKLDDILLEYDFTKEGIGKAARSLKPYKNYFIRKMESTEVPPDTIDVDWVAMIDGQRFLSQSDMARFLGVSRQSVSQAKQRGSTKINNYEIIWND